MPTTYVFIDEGVKCIIRKTGKERKNTLKLGGIEN